MMPWIHVAALEVNDNISDDDDNNIDNSDNEDVDSDVNVNYDESKTNDDDAWVILFTAFWWSYKDVMFMLIYFTKYY